MSSRPKCPLCEVEENICRELSKLTNMDQKKCLDILVSVRQKRMDPIEAIKRLKIEPKRFYTILDKALESMVKKKSQ